MTDFLRLDGQSALVTGAATGIGAAIAARLSRAGAAVCFADLDGEAANAAAAGLNGAFGLATDVCDPSSVEKAVAEVRSRTRAHRYSCEQCRHRGHGSAFVVAGFR